MHGRDALVREKRREDGPRATGHEGVRLTWPDLRRPNADAVVTLLETARELGVRRVVLASSVHAMGGYVLACERLVDPAWPVAQCCDYGAT